MTRFIFLFLAAFSCAAIAQPTTNFYALVMGGGTSAKASMDKGASDAALVGQGFTVLSSSESASSSSFGLGGGYRFSKNFAIEALWLDLGELHSYSATFTAGANNGNQSKNWKTSGIGVFAVGQLPLASDFSLIGKIGAYRASGEYKTSTAIYTPPGALVSQTNSSDSGSGIVPAVAIGFGYQVIEQLQVRAMYERWQNKSGLFGSGNDLNAIQTYTLGVTFRF